MKIFLWIFFLIFQGLCFTAFTAAGAPPPDGPKKVMPPHAVIHKPHAVVKSGTAAQPGVDVSPDSETQSDTMVKKHLFMPETYLIENGGLNGKKKPLSKIFRMAERQLVFSGVIASRKGKKALILNRGDKDPSKRRTSRILEKGDSIMDLLVKKVGPNFVILASKGETLRLNLYHGKKNRPRPIPQSKYSKTPGAANINTGIKPSEKTAVAAKTKTGIGKSTPTKTRAIAGAKTKVTGQAKPGFNKKASKKTQKITKTNNPFINAIKKFSSGKTTGKETNPFLEAIRKAREKQ